MPHTNRRKNSTSAPSQSSRGVPKAGFIKRQIVEDDDGWTHVIGERKVKDKSLAKGSNAPALYKGDFSVDGVEYVNKTLEEIAADYELYKKQWDQSDACAELKSGLAEHVGKREIDNVVCLGLGSFQSLSGQFTRHSHLQLAALAKIMDILNISDTPIISQDPHYTDLDKTFLKSKGHTITEDPDAFLQVKEKTLVYGIHCYPNIYQTVGEGILPAVLISNDLSIAASSGAHGEKFPAIEKMSENYEALMAFPKFRYVFSDTIIYAHKPAAVSG